MSSSIQASAPIPAEPVPAPPGPEHPIRAAVARYLAAHFRRPDDDSTPARADAHADALQAIAAYAPDSPHNELLVGRVLALSLASLHAAAQAVDPRLPARQQIQFLGKANSLSRSAQQAETALARSRQAAPPPATASHQRPVAPPQPRSPQPRSPQPRSPQARSESRPAVPDPHAVDALQALIDCVMADERSAASRSPATPPNPGRPPNPATAARSLGPLPVPARAASFRDALLQSGSILAGTLAALEDQR